MSRFSVNEEQVSANPVPSFGGFGSKHRTPDAQAFTANLSTAFGSIQNGHLAAVLAARSNKGAVRGA